MRLPPPPPNQIPLQRGLLMLGDNKLTHRALSAVAAASMTAVQGLLLAATEYDTVRPHLDENW